MRTHDLARDLMRLAKVLQKAPDLDLDELETLLHRPPVHLSRSDMAVSLSTLVDLSRIDKQQWMDFVIDYRFDIPIRARDASRDILGKLLRYLENTPEAREALKEGTPSRSSKSSPELMKALSSLLKGT